MQIADAIEWAVFNRSARELRATTNADLKCVRGSPDVEMMVEVDFMDVCTQRLLTISKRMMHGKAILEARVKNVDGSTMQCTTRPAITEIISSFNVDLKRVETIVLKQNTCTIACRSSQLLLDYLENVGGTSLHKVKISACDLETTRNLMSRQEELNNTKMIEDELHKMQPAIDSFRNIHSDLNNLKNEQLKLFASQSKKCDQAIKNLHADILSQSTAMAQAHDAETHAEQALNESKLTQISISESLQHRKARSSCAISLKQKVQSQYCIAQQRLSQSDKQIQAVVAKLSNLSSQNAATTAALNYVVGKIASLILQRDSLHDLNTGTSCSMIRRPVAAALQAWLDHDLQHQALKVSLSHRLKGYDEKLSNHRILSERQSLHARTMRTTIEELQKRHQGMQQQLLSLQLDLQVATTSKHDLERSYSLVDKEICRLGSSLAALSQREFSSAAIKSGRNLLQALRKSEARDDVLGMLCDVLQPRRPAYHTPLLAVLGNALTNTLIVRARPAAIIAASVIRQQKQRQMNMTIDITDQIELHVAPACPNASEMLRPLQECVNISHPAARNAVGRRLEKWLYYEGTGADFLSLPAPPVQTRAKNIVTVDGCIFLADGEIRRSSRDLAHKAGSSVPAAVAWPSCLEHQDYETTTQCDRIYESKATLQQQHAQACSSHDALRRQLQEASDKSRSLQSDAQAQEALITQILSDVAQKEKSMVEACRQQQEQNSRAKGWQTQHSQDTQLLASAQEKYIKHHGEMIATVKAAEHIKDDLGVQILLEKFKQEKDRHAHILQLTTKIRYISGAVILLNLIPP